jgi:uncharacterized protein (TIGR02284 family)
MIATEEPATNDAAELQRVLTRYVDSCEGYTQAATVTQSHDLSTAFLEIAERRTKIVAKISQLVREHGEKADPTSSPEAAIHRWWIRVRAEISSEELHATLAECIRGEKELRRTIQEAIDCGSMDSANSSLLRDISAELHAAIQTFESALGR